MSRTEVVSGKRAAEHTVAADANARPGAIFARAMQDNLAAILGWGLGYSLLIAAVAFLYPLLKQNNTLLGVLSSLNLFGSSKADGDMDPAALTTFAGYLGILALNLAPQVFSVFLIPQALGAVSFEEERGTIDLLLSTPLPRWRYLIEKALATVVSFFAMLIIMWVVLVICIGVVKDIHMPLLNAVAGIWHIAPVSLVIFAGTLLLSVLLRTGRQAGAVMVLIILFMFFWRTLLTWVDLPNLRPFTIFYDYRSTMVFANGFNWPLDWPMLLLAAVLFVAAIWQFNRRDLGI